MFVRRLLQNSKIALLIATALVLTLIPLMAMASPRVKGEGKAGVKEGQKEGQKEGKKEGQKKDRGAMLEPLKGVKRLLVLGDSITYAGGYVDLIDGYLYRNCPETHISVIDLGLPSETVSGLSEPNHAGGAFPRPDLHERMERALAKIKPDMVMACYGMNDGIYYPLGAERFQKYREGVLWLRERVRKAGARLWLVTPPPFDAVPLQGRTLPAGRTEYPSPFEGYDTVLGRYSEWLLEQKQKAGWNVIDIHTPLNAYLTEQRKTNPKFAFAGDGVHINAEGHRLLGREILRAWGAPELLLPSVEGYKPLPGRQDDPIVHFEALVHERQRLLCDGWLNEVGHKRPGMAKGVPIAEAETKAAELDTRIREVATTLPPIFPGTHSDYHGFDRYDFEVDGRKALVVTPHQLAKTLGIKQGSKESGKESGKLPWIWRAEFFDHRPELDLALLARGFHLVYIEVGNTFGAPSAMKHWDVFYEELTSKYGLSPKPTLEGLSRGGLYIYNWASAHPKSVSVLYGDNPVCDFKSWPGGKGKGPGSAGDWQKLQQDYGFKSEAEALAYPKNPVDNLAPLAKAHVPIIHLAADADEVVPYPENTVIIKERYEKLGGKIQVIVKPGLKHHPHGLDDPTPLVDFILAHTAG